MPVLRGEEYMSFLSHPIESKQPYLAKHCLDVAHKSKELIEQTGLDCVNSAFYAGLLHDTGKLNPYYQALFNSSPQERKTVSVNLQQTYFKGHAWLSVLAAYRLLKLSSFTDKEKNQALMAVAGHHTRLQQLSKVKANYLPDGVSYSNSFKKSRQEMTGNLSKYRDETTSIPELSSLNWDECLTRFHKEPEFNEWRGNPQCDFVQEYLEANAVFSALLQADRGSFNDWQSSIFNLELSTAQLARTDCKPSEGRKVRLFGLRTAFQDSVLSAALPDERLWVLEAPTGIGKTKLFLDMIKKLQQQFSFERVVYFSPLLALTDDFEGKLLAKENGESVIRKEDARQVLVYTHVSTRTLDEKRGSGTQEQDSANDLFLDPVQGKKWFEQEAFNKPLIITTMQRLLMTLYSNSKSDKMKILSLKNSLLILDEVQTIPKFLLPNFIRLMQAVAEKFNSRMLFVSATVPHQLSSLSEIEVPRDIIGKYLNLTRKNIVYRTDFVPEKECISTGALDRTLVMANTRRKALGLFDRMVKETPETVYLSSGIRKRTRAKIIESLKEKRNVMVVSTQVLEAGVDITFSSIFREMAPLDNLVQVLGRLDREAESLVPATLTVFLIDSSWLPYSELEYMESLAFIEKINNSAELYERLPEYYKKIAEENRKNKRLANELDEKMSMLSFDEVWEFVRVNALPEEYGVSVYVPETDEEWEEVKAYFSRSDKKKENRKDDYADLLAGLPGSPEKLGINHLFDEDLLEKGILLPKKEQRAVLYDETVGFDQWLRQ
ncbi:CRISPR-associated helicase Cas3' [Candidatus Micrarchaeota archaeon]|nr:CRISPR-associated helicase Cas3' [Candidatus Micrarchaeota archaeon]